MKNYTIKKLIKGYKLKPELKGLTLVGIPFQFKNEPINVDFNGVSQLINSTTPLLHKEMFRDKYGRDKYYVLYYYEWDPVKTQITLF